LKTQKVSARVVAYPQGREEGNGGGCILLTFGLCLHGVNPNNVYTTDSFILLPCLRFLFGDFQAIKLRYEVLFVRDLPDARYVLKN